MALGQLDAASIAPVMARVAEWDSDSTVRDAAAGVLTKFSRVKRLQWIFPETTEWINASIPVSAAMMSTAADMSTSTAAKMLRDRGSMLWD